MLSRTLAAVVSVAVAADEAVHLLQTQARAHRVEHTEEDDHNRPTKKSQQRAAEAVIEEAPRGAVAADFDALRQERTSVTNLKFEKVRHRNLGGLGPSKNAPEEIRYARVAKDFLGNPVDMILKATNYVTTKPGKTGILGQSAVINIKNGHEVQFTATFVNAMTDLPVEMMAFHLSFMDIDTGKTEGEEELTIGGFEKRYMLDDTELVEIKMADGTTKFRAGEPGVEADNPTDPLMLSDVQAKRTVSLQFPAGLSSFTFSYKVAKTGYTDFNYDRVGRYFVMAGMSSLYFCEAKPVVVDYNMASLGYSNLGGLGPDFSAPRALLFKDVAAVRNDQMLDLKIENMSIYTAFNTSQNRLSGEFGQLNIAGGTWCRFKFTFLYRGTDEPYVMPWNLFTIFDLDHGKTNEKYKESVEIKDFATHYLTENSELQLTEHGSKWYTYESSTWGTGDDNPTNPMNLTQQQKDRSVSLLFHERSSYQAKFGAAKPKKGGRNFLFSGKSALVFC